MSVGQVGRHEPVANVRRTESFDNSFASRLDAKSFDIKTTKKLLLHKNSFCCGKGCCPNGKRAQQRASLKLDPSLVDNLVRKAK